jgi:hypothetical protein
VGFIFALFLKEVINIFAYLFVQKEQITLPLLVLIDLHKVELFLD